MFHPISHFLRLEGRPFQGIALAFFFIVMESFALIVLLVLLITCPFFGFAVVIYDYLDHGTSVVAVLMSILWFLVVICRRGYARERRTLNKELARSLSKYFAREVNVSYAWQAFTLRLVRLRRSFVRRLPFSIG